LGPDEKSDQQIAYLKEHALDLLKSTLKVLTSFFLKQKPRH
jgi:hypothetical protein